MTRLAIAPVVECLAVDERQRRINERWPLPGLEPQEYPDEFVQAELDGQSGIGIDKRSTDVIRAGNIVFSAHSCSRLFFPDARSDASRAREACFSAARASGSNLATD